MSWKSRCSTDRLGIIFLRYIYSRGRLWKQFHIVTISRKRKEYETTVNLTRQSSPSNLNGWTWKPLIKDSTKMFLESVVAAKIHISRGKYVDRRKLLVVHSKNLSFMEEWEKEIDCWEKFLRNPVWSLPRVIWETS